MSRSLVKLEAQMDDLLAQCIDGGAVAALFAQMR